MTHYILTFIIGMEVGAIITLFGAIRSRRLDKEHYAKISEG